MLRSDVLLHCSSVAWNKIVLPVLCESVLRQHARAAFGKCRTYSIFLATLSLTFFGFTAKKCCAATAQCL